MVQVTSQLVLHLMTTETNKLQEGCFAYFVSTGVFELLLPLLLHLLYWRLRRGIRQKQRKVLIRIPAGCLQSKFRLGFLYVGSFSLSLPFTQHYYSFWIFMSPASCDLQSEESVSGETIESCRLKSELPACLKKTSLAFI